MFFEAGEFFLTEENVSHQGPFQNEEILFLTKVDAF